MTAEQREDSTPELMAKTLIEMAKISEVYRADVLNQKYYREKAESESKKSMEEFLKEREHSKILQRVADTRELINVESKKCNKAMEVAICDLIKSTKPDKKAIAKLKKTLESVYTFHESCTSSSPILDAICEAATKSKKGR